MKIEGSGSINQRHGSADPDPDPHQNDMDPQHCQKVWNFYMKQKFSLAIRKTASLTHATVFTR
jgi:hypothetical protein